MSDSIEQILRPNSSLRVELTSMIRQIINKVIEEDEFFLPIHTIYLGSIINMTSIQNGITNSCIPLQLFNVVYGLLKVGLNALMRNWGFNKCNCSMPLNQTSQRYSRNQFRLTTLHYEMVISKLFL